MKYIAGRVPLSISDTYVAAWGNDSGPRPGVQPGDKRDLWIDAEFTVFSNGALNFWRTFSEYGITNIEKMDLEDGKQWQPSDNPSPAIRWTREDRSGGQVRP